MLRLFEPEDRTALRDLLERCLHGLLCGPGLLSSPPADEPEHA